MEQTKVHTSAIPTWAVAVPQKRSESLAEQLEVSPANIPRFPMFAGLF